MACTVHPKAKPLVICKATLVPTGEQKILDLDAARGLHADFPPLPFGVASSAKPCNK